MGIHVVGSNPKDYAWYKQRRRVIPSSFCVTPCCALWPGINMLMVGVLGPRTPCEQILIKHAGNNKYNVSYVLKEAGEYMLVVKWGDQHVPGSPYYITVK